MLSPKIQFTSMDIWYYDWIAIYTQGDTTEWTHTVNYHHGRRKRSRCCDNTPMQRSGRQFKGHRSFSIRENNDIRKHFENGVISSCPTVKFDEQCICSYIKLSKMENIYLEANGMYIFSWIQNLHTFHTNLKKTQHEWFMKWTHFLLSECIGMRWTGFPETMIL